MECARCDLKRHRACTCGKVKKNRMERGASVGRHVGKRMSQQEPIVIGTECSGIEAPIVALRRMGVAHDHAYSTECNESAQVWSVYNYSPRVKYDDILERDTSALPAVDLYVCGIPCQEFSRMNQYKTGGELKCTALVEQVINAIRQSTPTSFVLENVPSFWKHALGRRVECELSKGYDILSNILSPHEYGAPQYRKRLYVVGIRKGHSVRPFEWPAKIELATKCIELLSNDLSEASLQSCKIRDKYYGEKISRWDLSNATPSIIAPSLHGLRPIDAKDPSIAPCVLASHPGLYATHLKRLLHPKELLRLQGFTAVNLPPSLSNSIVRRLIGNAMSVDVLMHLFMALFKCIGKGTEAAFATL